jgi:polysulfide reductase chain C
MPQLIQNTTQTAWGWLVITYLFLAGIGAGAYVTSWWVAKRGVHGALSLVGRYLAAPVVAVGTLLLVFDLGAGSHSLRIFYLYTHPSSIMSLGTWALTIFLVLSVVDGYGPLIGIRRMGWFGDLTALFAAFVAIYTGLLLGVVKVIPFWHNALLPVLFLLSACSTGIAVTILGALTVERRVGGDAETLMGLHRAVIVAEGVVLALFLFFAASGSSAAHFSFSRMVDGSEAVAFWLGLVAAGLIVPFVYSLLGRTSSLARLLHSPGGVVAESVLVLAGGFFLRYLVVSAGAFGGLG